MVRSVRFLTLLAAFALGAFLISPAHAQDTPQPPAARPDAPDGGPLGRLELIRKSMDDLDLSPDQHAKIDSLFAKAKDQIRQKIDDSQNLQPRERFQQLLPIFQDLRQQVGDVLTPEQKEKFQQKLQSLRPATQPSGPVQRLQQIAQQLDLTPEQKEQAQKIRDDAREKIQQIAQEANGDRDQIREKAAPVIRDALQQFRELLTPEQQQKLQELMRRESGPGTPLEPARRPGLRNRRPTTAPSAPDSGASLSPAHSPVAASAAIAVSGQPSTHPATTQPDQLELRRLDGRPLKLSFFKGKPLVLVFGSYSCPTFRDHAAALDELARHDEVKANFLVIYTREAHPTGGWEVQRNKEADISVPQHKDEAARLAAARDCRNALKLSLPFAIDTMDDAAANTFDAFPNGCVILGRDGQIVARQKWLEPHALRPLVEAAASLKPTTAPATPAPHND